MVGAPLHAGGVGKDAGARCRRLQSLGDVRLGTGRFSLLPKMVEPEKGDLVRAGNTRYLPTLSLLDILKQHSKISRFSEIYDSESKCSDKKKIEE